jgi:methylated-DNA-protein-cysteine methyltransferase-like protein
LDKKGHTVCRHIWNTVASIPSGCVATYGQVAKLSGLANGARRVGWALRSAPAHIDLPWHRVVNAQGKISIPNSDPAHQEQVRRLAAESVKIIRGKIEMSRYAWTPDLDELIWGPASFNVDEAAEEFIE